MLHVTYIKEREIVFDFFMTDKISYSNNRIKFELENAILVILNEIK